MPPLLFLAAADVARCGLGPAETTAAVREAFLALAAGRAAAAPNLHLTPPGRKFSAKAAVLPEAVPGGPGLAVLKWYGSVPANAARGLPEYRPMLLVNDADTGLPLALLDGDWITTARAAATSAVAAQALARPEARRLGLVGCGRQGLAHLETLAALWPLEQVTLHGRGAAGPRRAAARAEALGLRAHIVDDARDAVAGQDIVVSAIGKPAEPTPGFLRAEWVDTGALAVMVDMGLAWVRESLAGFDSIVSDELDPATRRSREALNYDGTLDADLASLLDRPILAGTPARQRQAFVFAGAGLADAAVAAAVYRRAVQLGLGTRLVH